MSLLTSLFDFWAFENSLTGRHGNVLSGNTESAFATGKIGTGWAHNATAARSFNFNTTFDMSDGDWSASIWFKFNTANGFYQDYFLSGLFEGGLQTLLHATSITGDPLVLKVSLYDSEGNQNTYNSESIDMNANWNHFAVSYDSSTPALTTWLNGTKKTHNPVVVIRSTGGGQENMLRTYANIASQSIDGSIDLLGLWTRQLTDADAAQLYNSGDGYVVGRRRSAYTSKLFARSPMVRR